MRVFVLDTNKKPLMPTHPAKARKMLREGRAAVWRRYPFTIILKEAMPEAETQPVELKVDPGSKTTGIALVQHNRRGKVVVWAANLQHRGQVIKRGLEKRRHIRRSRRGRKCRYRKPRFNRSKPKGWLAPSLKSRVDNVAVWAGRLGRLAPVTAIAVETVRFDTQLMQNPEVSGIAYQQGELYGYEVREYLLEKWGRKCAYCGAENVAIEVEHIIPKSRGGSNRVGNLTIACRKCNQGKGNQTAAEFGYPAIEKQGKQPSLRDAAAVNSIRYATGDRLKALTTDRREEVPVSFWSGGRTKYNRVRQGYEKDHWIDAACVGETGEAVYIPPALRPLQIKATGGGGTRQRTLIDKYGFQRRDKDGKIVVRMRQKQVKGFQTGDIVKAIVPAGKYAGTHVGRVAVRATGSFRVGTIDGINWKYCSLVQRADGYEYAM